MVNEIHNLLAEACHNLVTVSHSSSLTNTFMIMWSLVLSVTYVMVNRLIDDEPRRIMTWQLLWFNFVMALFWWILARTLFISRNFFAACPRPFIGMLAAFAIAAALLFAIKLQSWECPIAPSALSHIM